ncbi:Hint domain-containing protein [Vannielia litorea]|uniref:Hint domain-containing protein n=1 Tax=Vannielia litorea TaxID=1217970 RepID=UPI001BCC26FE|nr:Hint domain-containing protein [Vannielia litorea]MBS8228124.1 type I secretion protein [Vannielia litorea]
MTKVTLDFEGESAGTVVDDEYSAQGVTISSVVDGKVNYYKSPAMIFDTSNPTGGDWDLATSNLGNVLIISEDGDSNDPDDEVCGGKLVFDFDEEVTFHSLTLLDVEEGAKVKFYDADGNYMGSQYVTTHDNGQCNLDFGNIEGVGKVEVVLYGSGAIDNVSYTLPAPEGDGIVEGTGGDDLIDVAYTGDPEGDMIDNNDALIGNVGSNDDIVLAGDGDDTVLAGEGDDEVYGNGGADHIEGGAGNDVLIGDDGGSYGNGPGEGSSTQEVFKWSELDDKYGNSLQDGEKITSQTQDTGENSVTLTLDTSYDNRFSTDQQKVHSIDTGELPGANPNSSLESELDHEGDSQTYTLDFEKDAENVSFRVNDIDYDSTVIITAYDSDGNEVPVNMTAGSGVSLYDNDGVAGYETAVSNGGGDSDTSPTYSALVSIEGPVATIVITHVQDGHTNSGVNVTDIYFDTIVPGEGTGAEGADVIYGDAGDDYIEGNGGDDELYGGDGSDEVHGGDGDDFIDTSGNVGEYIPGISGSPDQGYPGIFPADADPNDDKDIVYGGAGNDTIITGDDDDYIEGGAGNDNIEAGFDDDTVLGGDGDDIIVGGEGNDYLDGGDGDDIIYGGLNPVFPDALNIPDDEGDLRPDNGDDVIHGGAGDDTIYGQDDDDLIYGDEGDDYIDAGVDDDEVYGGVGNDTIIGGEGEDTLSGGDDRDTFLGGNAGDHVDGGAGGDDFDTLDLTGSDVDYIEYTSPDKEDGIVHFNDGGTMTFEEIENVIPCFTPGTLIATPRGEVAVEELKVGDKVITRDNGIQQIRWLGRTDVSTVELMKRPALRPVRIAQGALGNGLPERDMLVSPQHRVLVASERAALYFEEREVLVAAKHLVNGAGIAEAADVSSVTYIHFMFEQHEVVLSDGAWTESFQPGDYTLEGLDGEQREELLAIFPELKEKAGRDGYTSARKSLKKHEALLLVQ